MQAMTKLISINFNNTNILRHVLVITIYFDKNMNHRKVQVARILSNKNHLPSSQFIEFIQNQVL